jgi:stage III sporulation protein SpoIIIAA
LKDMTNDLDLLLDVIPARIRRSIEETERDDLIEVVLDLGRSPEARFPGLMTELSDRSVTLEDLKYVLERLGKFGPDHRAGIERTLHRISAITNRAGAVIGLTCRVGRAVFGTVDILRDIIEAEHSILLLGRPGVGKTTLLREAARVMADELTKRVIIVDTSNEIGGDGDIPHPGIGRARRMQVPVPERQHAVMIEAVENHMPQVIVIDEIGTEAEAIAARTIAERGVQLIATAHGNTLENLLQNPTLCDLIGGIQVVTLSDEEARRRGTQKTVLERKAPPTFNVLIEIQEKDRLAIHHDVARVVDAFLRGLPLEPEIRMRRDDGQVEIIKTEAEAAPILPDYPARQDESAPILKRSKRRILRIFTYGVSRTRLERAIQKFRVPAYLVQDIDKADLVLTLKSQEKRQPKRIRDARLGGVPFYVAKSNTLTQIENFLRSLFKLGDQPEGEQTALKEAEDAIGRVFEEGQPVELSPQNSYMRRLQHQLAERYGLSSLSKGKEPFRRVVINPP